MAATLWANGRWYGMRGDCSLMNVNNERTLEYGSFNIKKPTSSARKWDQLSEVMKELENTINLYVLDS